MNFHGTIKDEQTTDPKAWPQLVKSAGKLERTGIPYEERSKHAKTGYQSDQGMRNVLNVNLKVTLTALEKEWLGADVMVAGAVWQVWSLHPSPKTVWLVREGSFMPEQVDALVRVQ